MNKEELELFLKLTTLLSKKERAVWNIWRNRLWCMADQLRDYAMGCADIPLWRREMMKCIKDYADGFPLLFKDEIWYAGAPMGEPKEDDNDDTKGIVRCGLNIP